MLIQQRLTLRGLAVFLGLFLVAGCASHKVEVRPNEFGPTVSLNLVIQNRMTNALTLVSPAPDVTLAPRQVEAGGHTRLQFVLCDQRNLAAAAEHEIVLVATNSSPYLVQKDLDLILRGAFGTTPPREIRIAIGPCLFEDGQLRDQVITISAAPLPGIPLTRLCP